MSEETNLDWRQFLTEGLLPVGRVHISIKDTNIKEKENDEGEKYKSIGIWYEIDLHEDITADKFRPEKGWLNFYLRGKTMKRFRNLYAGCTGRPIQPTSRDPETGKPRVDMDAVVRELNGLGCYTAYIWRENKDDGTFEGGPGWDFAQKMEEIRKPTNKFLKDEEEKSEKDSD